MAKKHMKGCAALLIVREMGAKSTRPHRAPSRTAEVRQTAVSAGEDAEKLESAWIAGGNGQLCWEKPGRSSNVRHRATLRPGSATSSQRTESTEIF